jgi:hypothetical protein
MKPMYYVCTPSSTAHVNMNDYIYTIKLFYVISKWRWITLNNNNGRIKEMRGAMRHR